MNPAKPVPILGYLQSVGNVFLGSSVITNPVPNQSPTALAAKPASSVIISNTLDDDTHHRRGLLPHVSTPCTQAEKRA